MVVVAAAAEVVAVLVLLGAMSDVVVTLLYSCGHRKRTGASTNF